jgi:hypothetical protein
MLDGMSEDPCSGRDLDRAAAEMLAKGAPQADVARAFGISAERVAEIADGGGASEGEPCDRLLTQVLAVRAAVEQVGVLIMELHLERCVLAGMPVDDARMQDLRASLKLWSRLN